MTQRVDAKGGNGGKKWDDGTYHDGLTKINVLFGLDRGHFVGIQYIYSDYVKNGQPKYGSFHGFTGESFTETFEINHRNNEYLESVEGYYKTETDTIQSLQFKTNFRTSESMGYHNNGTKFTLAVDRKKIIGFHGFANGRNLNSLGAYFTWITPTKLEAKGGKGGNQWDDGVDHEGLTKIHVQGGPEGIQFVKFDYVKNGQPKGGQVNGLLGRGFIQQFEINHHEGEYIISVEGYYDEASGVIQGLQFKTNIKISELIGYEKETLPPTKLERQGGTIGRPWDDGAFHGVRKVNVLYSARSVDCIKFEYDNDGKVEKRQHGFISKQEGEFVVDYPNEFITSVEGTFMYDTDTWVTSLTFKTSKGRTSPKFGNVSDDDKSPSDFVLENKGCALVGFHGRSTDSGTFPDTVLIALGAYFHPLPPPPSSESEKLVAQGGDGGDFWDDGGNFDGVKKIYIGHNEIGVTFLKFLYDKNAQVFVGDDHRSKTLLGVEEFELEYPREYLTSVEVSYDKVDGSESEVVRMLKFKTNKRTSRAFGLDTTNSSFVLHKEGHKIVGFHGKANNMLHQIGVHVLPISDQV
ncbi:unnamed protein product [Microthlaspi erraticum]|uniref:Jacalin-type lectin domain-containing protein n=1 Tax=Microthlaspi erraticum TaxID=1685480 RepID=A0A6D2J5X7_9BRAS|nr:unnamed protein product [Microthlaspi erraticum]